MPRRSAPSTPAPQTAAPTADRPSPAPKPTTDTGSTSTTTHSLSVTTPTATSTPARFTPAGPPGPGRPSTLEAYPEKAEIIIAALGRGHYVTHAADLAGVTREAVERWLRLGQEHAESHQDSVYAAFFHKASAATAQWLDGRLQAVQSAGEKDWKASASLMGRRFRGYWSEQPAQGESGTSGVTINIGIALPGVAQSSQVIEGTVVSVPEIEE